MEYSPGTPFADKLNVRRELITKGRKMQPALGTDRYLDDKYRHIKHRSSVLEDVNVYMHLEDLMRCFSSIYITEEILQICGEYFTF